MKRLTAEAAFGGAGDLEVDARVTLWRTMEELPPEWEWYANLRRGKPSSNRHGGGVDRRGSAADAAVVFHASPRGLLRCWLNHDGRVIDAAWLSIGADKLTRLCTDFISICSDPDVNAVQAADNSRRASLAGR